MVFLAVSGVSSVMASGYPKSPVLAAKLKLAVVIARGVVPVSAKAMVWKVSLRGVTEYFQLCGPVVVMAQ